MILRTGTRKNYRILFLSISGISSCGISQGKIIPVNYLLCYRFFGIKDKKMSALKMSILGGNPVIQAVEAKMLGLFYKIFILLQNISSRKKSSISIHYELRNWVGGYNRPLPPRSFPLAKGPGP